MFKRWLIILLQTGVTIGLLVFFFHDEKFRHEAWDALRQADPRWLLLGVAIAGVENFLGVLRWRIFLRMLGMQVPFWKSLQICLVALFCNTFLIGAAGGDLVRMAWLIRRGFGKTDSLLSVIMDRVSGLGALIVYTAVLCAWNYEWLMQSATVVKMFAFVVAYQFAALLLIVVTLIISARGLTNRLPKWAPFPEFVRKLGAGYGRMFHEWPGTLKASGLSMVMMAAYFTVFWCTARAFGQGISFIHLSALMPVADVISALPISIGGLGVREGTFVVMLGQLAGVPGAMAVSISLIGYLVNVSWGLVGAAILPFFKGIVHDAREAASAIR
ncbi:MAG: lysylphosphatidylglycerol synthase transmembrane domain-containing protein [Chthoniobacterales bacterium]